MQSIRFKINWLRSYHDKFLKFTSTNEGVSAVSASLEIKQYVDYTGIST